MDEEAIKTGFKELDDVSSAEYHQSLAEMLDESDKEKVASRLGRLVGVLIKEPFAQS